MRRSRYFKIIIFALLHAFRFEVFHQAVRKLLNPVYCFPSPLLRNQLITHLTDMNPINTPLETSWRSNIDAERSLHFSAEQNIQTFEVDCLAKVRRCSGTFFRSQRSPGVVGYELPNVDQTASNGLHYQISLQNFCSNKAQTLTTLSFSLKLYHKRNGT